MAIIQNKIIDSGDFKNTMSFFLFVLVANGDVIGAQVFHYSFLHVHLE